MLVILLVALSLAQIINGEPLKDYLKHELEEKIDDAFKNLLQPLTNEAIRLDYHLEVAKRHLTSTDVNHKSKLNFLQLNFHNVNFSIGDKCQNLSNYLPIAQQTVEKVFYLSTDISGALAGAFLDGLSCFDLNIFRSVACLIDEVHQIKVIYTKYKPQIDPIIAEIKSMSIELLKLLDQCVNEI